MIPQELGFADGHWDGGDFCDSFDGVYSAEKWNLINFLVGHIFLANEITRILYYILYNKSALQFKIINLI